MGEEEEVKKVETEVPVTGTAPTPPPAPVTETAPPPSPPAPVEATKDVTEEKAVVPHVEEKVDDSKAIAVVDKAPGTEIKKNASHDRDIALGRVESEKKLSLVKAWEDNEITKARNKAEKILATIDSWENTKKANIEAEIKKKVEEYEKKKAAYVEQMKNKIALIHKEAEEKKARVYGDRGEELIEAEEKAAKCRATNSVPKSSGCFGY